MADTKDQDDTSDVTELTDEDLLRALARELFGPRRIGTELAEKD